MQDLSWTHSQQPIWVGQRLSPESPLYNMAFAFVFPGHLRPDAFQDAWRQVVARNEVLRTSVLEPGGLGQPTLVPSPEVVTRTRDLTGSVDPLSDFQRWCDQEASRPLPLDGPLVQSTLVDLGDLGSAWFLNQHHLTCDAWSTVLLYQEVAEAYEAFLGGGSVTSSPIGYYRTASELVDAARPEVRQKSMAHWQTRVDSAVRPTPLYGRDGAPVGTASSRLTLALDEHQAGMLFQLASQDGLALVFPEMSRFSVLAALLLGWMQRVSGTSDLGFDAPIAGRPTPASKRALGPFIELFPFTATVSPEDTLRTLLDRCLAETRLFLTHALPGTSTPSEKSVHNVVLNYFPRPFGSFAGLTPNVRWVHPGHGDRMHALRVQVHDFSGTGRYTLHFDVNNGVLGERVRARAVEHFDRLTSSLLADPDRAIGSVDIRTEEERARVVALNDVGPPLAPGETVVAMIDRQTALTPDLPALSEGKREVSFGELQAQAEALSRTLLHHGVRPGDRVALLTRRSTLAVAAILGILKARAAYVPIDPGHPAARLREIREDSGARHLLLGPGVDASKPIGCQLHDIETSIEFGSGLSQTLPVSEPEDLAYVLYTSGSTGRPKGVLVEQRGLVDYLIWAQRTYVRGDRLRFPLCTSLAFDLTVTSLFLPLISGGTLEVYPEHSGTVDSSILAVGAANTVDFIKLTPSHLSLLLRAGLQGSKVRRMVVGGEDFPTRLAAEAQAQLGADAEIYNEYGPTEAVVGCILHRYDATDHGASVPIGVPASGVAVAVLNEVGTPVPEGVPGELWVSRHGLARGYHRRDDLTATRFVPDPERPGRRRYRTGDLVRLAATGTFEFLGRTDRQLKVAGFRVEPGEVEAAVASFPGIEECVVLPQPAGRPPTPLPHEVQLCVRCGLPSNYPGVDFTYEGVCSTCVAYETIEPAVQRYFKPIAELRTTLSERAKRAEGTFDCMMLLSGGKDSTYALCRLVDMGFAVYAFTLDNGFISEGAKDNMGRVTDALGVPLEVATTPAMNAIFRDSLRRFSNVCQGCFKTIYTLSTNRARELGIPTIVTGLSRGQMFETRLTHEMFRDGRCTPAEVDAAVAAARKVYHRLDDEVARSLDVEAFQDDRVFDQIQFVDFYRYCSVDLADVFAYLGDKVPWVRPADTGRSTNCLINDIGIYVHKREQGYHNYALPYSWDVRLGHKTRAEALDELDDDLDLDHVSRTLEAIDYPQGADSREDRGTVLSAFYVASIDIDEAELREHLRETLPAYLVPRTLERIDAIPLTVNGKVDETALPRGAAHTRPKRDYVPPVGPVEEFLTELWSAELGVQRVGATDDFFELGGTSLNAMEVTVRLCREFDIELPLEVLFEASSLRELARRAEQRILDQVADLE